VWVLPSPCSSEAVAQPYKYLSFLRIFHADYRTGLANVMSTVRVAQANGAGTMNGPMRSSAKCEKEYLPFACI
jgi:hypothetical protein